MIKLLNQAFSLLILLPACLALECKSSSSIEWPVALSPHGGNGGGRDGATLVRGYAVTIAAVLDSVIRQEVCHNYIYL